MARAQKKQFPLATIEEAAECERQIGDIIRQIRENEVSRDEELVRVAREADEKIMALQRQAFVLGRKLHAYAEKERGALTENGKRKVVALGTAGIVQWYRTPAALSAKNPETIIAYLEEAGLTRFIRTKKELDRETMLKEQEAAVTIPGVTITQRDKFFIRPADSGDRLECDILTHRWKLSSQSAKEPGQK